MPPCRLPIPAGGAEMIALQHFWRMVVHYYQYLHDSRIIESVEPRPDLLEWAYWTEIPAPAKPKPEPEPEAEVDPAVEHDPEPDSKPARKAPAKKAAPRKPETSE